MTWIPPQPPRDTRGALLGGLFRQRGLSMLSLLPRSVYKVQMGATKLMGRGLFLVNAPETVRHVMTECPASYPKHHYIEDILRPLIGVSLFNANGEAWQRQRRIVDQAFVQAALRRVFPVMLQGIDDMLQRLDAVAERGQCWEAEEAMGHVTADIIFRTILSTPLDARAATDVHHAFRGYQAAAQRVMGLSAMHLPTFWHRRQCRHKGTAIRES
jgi:cytochrome P450